MSCPVSYSWQFILQEFSHLGFQWLIWWTFYPFPGKSPVQSGAALLPFFLHFHVFQLFSILSAGERQKYFECTRICNATGKQSGERNIWKTKMGTESQSLFWKKLPLGRKAGEKKRSCCKKSCVVQYGHEFARAVPYKMKMKKIWRLSHIAWAGVTHSGQMPLVTSALTQAIEWMGLDGNQSNCSTYWGQSERHFCAENNCFLS